MTEPRDIYLLGICGTGVGALAGLLKAQGHRVRGSDEHVYPPMSDKLAEWGIPVLEGFDAAHLQPHPDLVVVGNIIRAHNPEAVYARQNSLCVLSMPQALAELGIGDKHSIVVAGTHGKTSITALIAHVLTHAGRDPSFLVGGALVGYIDSFRHGHGDFFVVEGDEYDTAYFDKGPKFLHYRARTALITSLEFDHADIFDSVGAIEGAFQRLLDALPASGHAVVWHGASRARALLGRAQVSRRTIYATQKQPDANLWTDGYECGPLGLTLEPVLEGKSLGVMGVPLWGEFGAQNVLATLGVLRDAQLSADELRAGLASFRGVRRRLEVIGEPAGITVVDDFGHHPTAIGATLAAARTRWPGRRLWALFEPRSATSRRNVLQAEFCDALAGADRVVVGSHPRMQEIPAAERFDPAAVVRSLGERGIEADWVPEVNDLALQVCDQAATGDVILVFSNGSFGGLHGKLQKGLQPAP